MAVPSKPLQSFLWYYWCVFGGVFGALILTSVSWNTVLYITINPVLQSPTEICEKILAGDEVIQVNGQIVVSENCSMLMMFNCTNSDILVLFT